MKDDLVVKCLLKRVPVCEPFTTPVLTVGPDGRGSQVQVVVTLLTSHLREFHTFLCVVLRPRGPTLAFKRENESIKLTKKKKN